MRWAYNYLMYKNSHRLQFVTVTTAVGRNSQFDDRKLRKGNSENNTVNSSITKLDGYLTISIAKTV